MIVKTNKENWTDEKITVSVNKQKRTFNLFGYKFKIVRLGKDVYYLKGNAWNKRLASIFVTESNNVVAISDYCEREGSNIFEASIKLLCNII